VTRTVSPLLLLIDPVRRQPCRAAPSKSRVIIECALAAS
jgi:hypothetical protein